MSKVTLEFVSKGNKLSKLKKIDKYSKLRFRVDATKLGEFTEDTPGILKGLTANPFMLNSSLIAEIGENGIEEEKLLDLVNYLYEDDGCKSLIVEGLDSEGKEVKLDFSNTYTIYKTEIEVRNKFIDEKTAKNILSEALISFDKADLL